jgi:hypothetical protein
MKTALITGVSSGIGRGIASVLIKNGWRVYGSVRKAADARAFEVELGANAKGLVFDVSDEAAIAAAAKRLAGELGAEGLAALVNNAGISVHGPLQFVSLDRVRQQLEVNVVGVLAVTQAFLPLLGAGEQARKNPGKIINISSVSGRRALPFFGPYAASKFALEAINDSLRRELIIYGIDVIAIEPGPIQSEIWGKALSSDLTAYDKTPYRDAIARIVKMAENVTARALPAEDVGRLALRILNNARPKTRYIIQRGGIWPFLLQSLPPDRVVDRAAARALGLKRLK